MSEEPEKRLQTGPFVAHATRGIIRDRGFRRKTIAILLGAALLMVIAGTTLLRSVLDPREGVMWFAIYWLVCAWLTFTALLLALYDLLALRLEGREARRALREKTMPPPPDAER